MVIWPWSRFRQLEQSYLDMVEQHNRLSARHNAVVDIAAKDAEIAGIYLRTAERDLERLSNEYNLLKADFKGLVAQTAGRLQPRVQPLDLDRDPFREDPKIPTEWLTDDSELPDIAAEELLDRGQSEDGEQRGPAARQGAEGPS